MRPNIEAATGSFYSQCPLHTRRCKVKMKSGPYVETNTILSDICVRLSVFISESALEHQNFAIEIQDQSARHDGLPGEPCTSIHTAQFVASARAISQSNDPNSDYVDERIVCTASQYHQSAIKGVGSACSQLFLHACSTRPLQQYA